MAKWLAQGHTISQSLSRISGRTDTQISILHMRKSAPEILAQDHGDCCIQSDFPFWVCVKCPEGRKSCHIWAWELFGGRAESNIASAHRGYSPLCSNPGALLSFCASSLGCPSTVASAAGDRWNMAERSPGHVWLCWSPHFSRGPLRLGLIVFFFHGTLPYDLWAMRFQTNDSLNLYFLI